MTKTLILAALIASFFATDAIAECPPSIASGISQNQANHESLQAIFIKNLEFRDRTAFDCLDLFLKAGADPNEKTKSGETPLSMAAGNAALARALVKKGADPKAEANGWILLHEAAQSFSFEDFKYWENIFGTKLLDVKPYKGESLLHLALKNRDERIGTYLVEKGCDINIKGPFEMTPLLKAIALGKTNIVRALVAKGANLNDQDITGRTVLMTAANAPAENRLSILKLLTKAGLDLDRPLSRDRDEPLLAVSALHLLHEEFSDLLEAGASVKVAEDALKNNLIWNEGKWHGGLLPLVGEMHETPRWRSKKMKTLLAKGADPNARDQDGNTALIWAAKNFDLDLLKTLIAHGADINAQSIDGDTALNRALRFGQDEMADYLFSKGALINKETLDGIIRGECDLKRVKKAVAKGARLDVIYPNRENLIHRLAEGSCKREVLKYFIEQGADLNAKNVMGATPLNIAVALGNLAMAEMMLDFGADLKDFQENQDWSFKLLNITPAAAKIKLLLRKHAQKQPYEAWVKSAGAAQADEEDLKKYFVTLWSEKKKVPSLPVHASERLKVLQAQMKLAESAPWDLTAISLDQAGLPSFYYRKILEAAKTPEARTSQKFKPTADQARQVLRAMVADGDASASDYELMAWLVAQTGMPLDTQLLDLFDFKAEEIKKDVDEMIATDPLKYRGSPNIGVLKMIKALLAHEDWGFSCADGVDRQSGRASASDKNVRDILHWLGVYGDNPVCDKVFLSKLIRLVLETKKVCPQDRDFILRAMKGWGRVAAPVQHEVACAIASSMQATERSFEEFLLISQGVGLRSELSQAGWLEQMAAFEKIRPSAERDEIYQGLLKYSLGVPEGGVQKRGDLKLKLASNEGHPGSLVKLCRLMQSMAFGSDEERRRIEGAGWAWIAVLKGDLERPRRWPADLNIAGGASTLAGEFERAGMQEDLRAVQSECKELPDAGTVQKAGPAPVPVLKPVSNASTERKRIAPPAPKSEGESFDPRRRVKK